MAHATSMKEIYQSMKLLLGNIKYGEFKFKLRGDLKFVALLLKFVALLLKFVALLLKFVALLLKFVALLLKFVALLLKFVALLLKFVALLLKFVALLLTFVALLLGTQLGHTKYCCFLCEWGSRDKKNHYVNKLWPKRTSLTPGEGNVV